MNVNIIVKLIFISIFTVFFHTKLVATNIYKFYENPKNVFEWTDKHWTGVVLIKSVLMTTTDTDYYCEYFYTAEVIEPIFSTRHDEIKFCADLSFYAGVEYLMFLEELNDQEESIFIDSKRYPEPFKFKLRSHLAQQVIPLIEKKENCEKVVRIDFNNPKLPKSLIHQDVEEKIIINQDDTGRSRVYKKVCFGKYIDYIEKNYLNSKAGSPWSQKSN